MKVEKPTVDVLRSAGARADNAIAVAFSPDKRKGSAALLSHFDRQATKQATTRSEPAAELLMDRVKQ